MASMAGSRAGDQAQLVLVQNMGHMFAKVGPKQSTPVFDRSAQTWCASSAANGAVEPVPKDLSAQGRLPHDAVADNRAQRGAVLSEEAVLVRGGFTLEYVTFPEHNYHAVLSMDAQSNEKLILEIKRVFAAPVDAVFAALSDSDSLRKWWGPAGIAVTSVNFRPHLGERYRIEMQPQGGEVFHLTGEFREVDRPARLAYTFAYEEPDDDDIETLVTLTVRNLGRSTEVVLTQGPFKTEARRALHRDGWLDSFDKLDRLIART